MSKDSKTEQPTQKRMRDALKKGQVIVSKELYSFFAILGLFLGFAFLLPMVSNKCALYLRGLISNAGNFAFDGETFNVSLSVVLKKVMWFCIPFFLILFLLGLFANFSHHLRFVFSWHSLALRLENLSPMKGIEKMISFKNFVELLKSCLKILVVCALLYFLICKNLVSLHRYLDFSAQAIVAMLYDNTMTVLGVFVLITGVIGIGDYLFQRRQYFTNLKMTKQELRDESRETEGNPEMKKRMRKQMAKQLARSVVSAIQRADVLVTNPEHFAVALEYKEKYMHAPFVTAKGQDEMALQMKSLARENRIVIVQNPKLARSLYEDLEINEPIAVKHYEIVAQVLNYALSLRKARQKW
jgi:flagellar biosynthetic protein FlhB